MGTRTLSRAEWNANQQPGHFLFLHHPKGHEPLVTSNLTPSSVYEYETVPDLEKESASGLHRRY